VATSCSHARRTAAAPIFASRASFWPCAVGDAAPFTRIPFAFAAASLVLDAIEKVGPDRKKVRNELNRTHDYDSVVGKISFDDHRQNAVPLITKFVVQGGKWLVWEDSEYAAGKRPLVR
jgi:ABC-type branched-subunit amino acid transport system substrate-binding protein